MQLEAQNIRLNNGQMFPAIGYGTFDLRDDAETAAAVLAALDAGYRLIDTASNYGNETGVGEGVRRSHLPRSDIFVSSKVWPTDLGYEATLRAFEDSLSRLGLEYMDLYLIHWPCSPQLNAGSWKAMERLQADQRVRHIGVSNFNISHLQALAKTADIPPLVNQVEFHPLFYNTALRDYCQSQGILLEAWSPLMQGKAFSCETLAAIARKHNKSAAQVTLRWCIQMGAVPIPKTKNPLRMRENLALFDFHLDPTDMDAIQRMNTGKPLVGPDPDSYRFCPERPASAHPAVI
jgi:diketogulonate reductase-like aldo/keto reductase